MQAKATNEDYTRISENILTVFFVRKDCYGTYLPTKEKGQKAQPRTEKTAINLAKINAHLNGRCVIGAHCVSKENRVKWDAFDLDASGEAKEAYRKGDKAKLEEEKERLFLTVIDITDFLKNHEISYIVEDSVGGYHIWLLFDAEIPAAKAHSFIKLIAKILGISCELYPKQPALDNEKPFGNWLRLPGRYHSTQDFCSIYNGGNWLSCKDYEKAWQFIASIEKNTEKKVDDFLAKYPIPEAPVKTLPAKQKKNETVKRAENVFTSDIGQWLDSKLNGVDLFQYLSSTHTITKAKQYSATKHAFCCIFHDDKEPSAWIEKHNGIDFYHCKSPNCKAYGKGRHAFLILRELENYTFKDACIELFGEYPQPTKIYRTIAPQPNQTIQVQNIEPTAQPKTAKVSNSNVVKSVKDSLCDTQHIFNLTQAPTGVGKTKQMAKCLTDDIAKKEAIRAKWNNDLDDSKKPRPICSYITDTKDNIYAFRDDIVELGCKRKDFSVQIGKDIADKEQEKEGLFEPKGTEGIRTGNLGHYNWLGFKGHLPETYAVAGYQYQDRKTNEVKIRHGLATAYQTYLDEFHNLLDVCIVQHPLCSAYLLKKLGRNEKLFPTNRFQGVKLDYFLHWPEKATYQRYEYESIHKVAFDNDSGLRAKKNLDFLGIDLGAKNRDDFFAQLQNPIHYSQLHNTLFVLELPQPEITSDLPERLTPEAKKKLNEYDYLVSLHKYIFRPSLQIHFPLKKDTGLPLSITELKALYNDLLAEEKAKFEKDWDAVRKNESSMGRSTQEPSELEKREQIEKEATNRLNGLIVKPDFSAYAPQLCGYNVLPLIQLMKFAKTINAFSATLDDAQLDTLKFACNLMGWKLQENIVENAPVKFPTHIMRLSKANSPSYPELAELLVKLTQRKEAFAKTFTVTWKRSQLNELWELIDKAIDKLGLKQSEIKKLFSRFVHNGHCTEYIDAMGADSNILTHDLASITQGANLYIQNVGIIDCGLWIPRAAIAIKCQDKTKEEIERVMLLRIAHRILQISGRLLRDKEVNKQRMADEANGTPQAEYKSKKKICYLLMNLTDGLANFEPDRKVCEPLTIHKEENNSRFFSKLPDHLVDSLVENIANCLAGNEITNWALKDAEISAKKPMREMSNKERKASEPFREEAKLQEKLQSLVNRAKEMKLAGKKRSEIYKALNLNRNKDLVAAIEQELGF